MSELKNLSAILEGGAVPAGYNGKAIGKLSKTYLKLENRKVVNLYPIRTVMHEDSRYCLYACPLKGTEIDEATLQSIKAEVDTLEIGEIRYDSVQSCGYDYYIVDPDTPPRGPVSGDAAAVLHKAVPSVFAGPFRALRRPAEHMAPERKV